jgi:hypothetical protein
MSSTQHTVESTKHCIRSWACTHADTQVGGKELNGVRGNQGDIMFERHAFGLREKQPPDSTPGRHWKGVCSLQTGGDSMVHFHAIVEKWKG